ncbi:site-2 protease family protein [Fimbriiglobus ruber]|uniref:Peptidase M50 domain-containing protein n=1 Tax=Fimbriiglobus ruber TaxID=1908690 RepID=A0A225D4Y0_9BACT|nr:site-2 protease family protein [Fimbriiglobus ruber]OWK36003.1 hypothetical protein FRUB_08566 [Fimbriiglobus ruber]
MIAEPQPTPYDLTFRIFRFPVRIHPMFWLTTLLTGQTSLQRESPLPLLAIWVAVVFVSILVHELGHAFAFRWFRADSRVCLYWFGGLATSNNPPGRPWPSIAVSLAGPGAGFILAAIVFATNRASGWSVQSLYTYEAYYQLMWVNLAWGLMNLLPVLPLDGGQVCRQLYRIGGARRSEEAALKTSVAVGAVVAAYGLMDYLGQPRALFNEIPSELRFQSLFTTVLFALLAYGSYQALEQLRSYSPWESSYDDTPWRRR